MPHDDEDLKTVKEAMKEWGETLPANHAGRVLLAALHAMEEKILAHRALEGPEDPARPIWDAILALGTTTDGALKYFFYPAAQHDDDLRNRDALLAAIAGRQEPELNSEEALADAHAADKTLVMAYYGHLEDGIRLLGIAWQPHLSFTKAVGYLKLAIRFIRRSEAAAAKGGS